MFRLVNANRIECNIFWVTQTLILDKQAGIYGFVINPQFCIIGLWLVPCCLCDTDPAYISLIKITVVIILIIWYNLYLALIKSL